MYVKVKYKWASCCMYKVLSTCFSHFQRAKYIEIINKKVKLILFKLQGFFVCKFENIIRCDLWLFSQKPNLLEKKDTLGPEGCKVACTHNSLKPWLVSLGTDLVNKTLLAWNNFTMLSKSRADFWDWLDDFAYPHYKELLECDLEEAVKWRQGILIAFQTP